MSCFHVLSASCHPCKILMMDLEEVQIGKIVPQSKKNSKNGCNAWLINCETVSAAIMHLINLIFTEDGSVRLNAEMYLNMDGHAGEPEWFPSAIYQADIEKIISFNGESDTADQLFCEAETSHGPTWLVRRHVKIEKEKEKNSGYKDNFVQQLTLEIKKELAAKMEEKLNKKVQENLRRVLKKMGEANPGFNLEVEELYKSNFSDGENGTPVTQPTPIEGTKAATIDASS